MTWGKPLISSIFLQIPDFKFDRNSFILGIVVGVVLAFLFVKGLPFLRRYYARLRGWIQAKLTWMRSGVEERFQGETADYAEQQHLGKQWATLSQVFVTPRLTAPPVDAVQFPEDRGATHFATLWPELAVRVGAPVPASMSVDALLRNGRRVLITGEAGTGKSTLLAHVAHQVATAQPESAAAAFVPFVPVLLHVAELDVQMEADAAITTPIVKALQRRASPITSPGIGDMLDRKLADGQLLLLLDGWDELSAEERPSICEWLRELIKAQRKLRIFMAADLDGYGPLLEMNFTVTRILPWRLGQVQQLAHQWQTALSLDSIPDLADFWQPGQSVWETCLRLWQTVLLGGQRPSRTVDLLEAVIPLFTNPKHKSGEPWVSPETDVISFWEDLAFTMLQRPSMSLSTQEIRNLSEPSVSEEETEASEKSVGGRLRKSLSQNGLFMRYGSRIGFQSTLWRDFFAGNYMAQENLRDTAVSHLDDPFWRGAIDVYVAQSGAAMLADSLLQKRAETVSQDALFQVAAWMPVAQDAGDWRRQVMIALGQLLRQEDVLPVLRLRAMAAMALSGEQGVLTFVQKLLEHPNPFLRQMGTMALPVLADNQVVGLLAKQLEDADGVVRETAVNGLMGIQNNPLTERPILMALIGADEEVSLLTAELLALSGAPGTEILREALSDEDIQVRRAAVHGLQQVDADWLEGVLVELERGDTEWFVRSAASGALAALRQRRQPVPWYPVDPTQEEWLANYALHQGYELPKGAGTVPVLLQVMAEAESSKLRASSALLLSQLPAPGVQSYLQTAVADEDALVRESAYMALVQNGRAYSN